MLSIIHTISSPLFVPCSGTPPDLHSFPTRRSSDLTVSGHSSMSDPGTLAGAQPRRCCEGDPRQGGAGDRKSTRLNSSHRTISYAVFCLKKKKPSPSILII